MTAPTLADIYTAQQRIAPFIHHTPTLHSQALDEMSHAKLFFKCENFQKIGAFKARGAHNAVLSLGAAELNYGVGYSLVGQPCGSSSASGPQRWYCRACRHAAQCA